MVLPAGVPPASVHLEGGCLMCSATAAWEIGQRGRSCTCGPPVPSRVRWLLRYALLRPGLWLRPGRWNRGAWIPWNRPRGKMVAEWESHPPVEVYEASLCALVEFPAVKGVESVGNAPTSACWQGKCIACLPRPRESIANWRSACKSSASQFRRSIFYPSSFTNCLGLGRGDGIQMVKDGG